MKTLSFLTLSVVTGSLLTLTAQAGILGVNNAGSPHDFSGESWNTSPKDPHTVCGTCHTPHHADSTVVPLWGHATTASTFIMYNTNTVPVSSMQATVAASPNGPSLACLSCHDGTLAVNTYGAPVKIGALNGANLGTDLTHSHPISFTYDSVLATKDSGVFDPSTTQVLQPDSGNFVAQNDMTVKGFLLNGKATLECTSCHDVHNQTGTPFDINNNPNLVKIVGTQAGKGSLLCRSCHNK